MRHITYLITRTELGGAQSHLYELLCHQVSHAKLTLISGEDDWLADKARALNIDVIIIKSLTNTLNPITNIRCLCKLRQTLRSLNPDLLHIHSSKAGVLGRLASIKLSHKTLFTAHGWAFGDDKPRLRHYLALISEKICTPLCDGVITVSQYDYQLALDMNLSKTVPFFMVHNGIADNTDEKATNRINQRDEFVIAIIARLALPKDVASLIRAVALVNKQNVEHNWVRMLRCLIIGDGPDKNQLEQLSQTLATDNIEFLGKREDINELLSSINAFVLVSHWEGLPISIIEAMRAGLPVIASDVGGVSEQVVDGYNGYLLPTNSPERLAEKIQTLMNHQDISDNFSKKARKQYLEYFHVDLMVDKTNAVYDNLIYNKQSIDNSVN